MLLVVFEFLMIVAFFCLVLLCLVFVFVCSAVLNLNLKSRNKKSKITGVWPRGEGMSNIRNITNIKDFLIVTNHRK